MSCPRQYYLLLGLLVAVTTGCGDEFQIAPVSGRITVQGKGIKGVFVTFQPIGGGLEDAAGPASYAHTDDDGRYELKLITDDEEPGAVVGTHRVILQHRDDETLPGGGATSVDLSATESDEADMAAARRRTVRQRKIPLRFRNGSVKIEVPAEGLAKADFDLQAANADRRVALL